MYKSKLINMNLKKQTITKVSTNYQTYVPVEIQKYLELNVLENLEWSVDKGGKVNVTKAKSQLENVMSYKGRAKGRYKKIGGVSKWIEKEKESSWKD